MVGSCEHAYVVLGLIKCGKFFGQLSDSQLLRNDSGVWTYDVHHLSHGKYETINSIGATSRNIP